VAGAGTIISATDATKNQGSGSAPASVTRFYLSADSTLGAGDIELASRAVPPLSPGATSTGSTLLAIPAGTPDGSYVIIARADADNSDPADANATNNTQTKAIKIGPDLTVSALSAPAAAGAGLRITVTDTIKNAPAGSPAGPSTTRIYLSTDGVFGGGDIELASRTVAALPAGQASTASTEVTIPPGTAAGTYFIIARADADNSLPAETTETNNTRTKSIKVGPDLILSVLGAPAFGRKGASITITDTTANGATASPAATSTTRFYLSADGTLGAGDVQLGSRSVSTLSSGASSTAATQVTIPEHIAPGKYFIIAQADADATVPAETSEANNSAKRVIKIVAPLTIGPMVGHTTHTSSLIRVRTGDEAMVSVVVSLAPDLSSPSTAGPVPSLASNDLSAVVPVTGLLPQTVYHYDVLINDVPVLRPPYPSFRTFPAPESPARVKIAFSACTRFQSHTDQTMWDAIAQRTPDVMLELGDNVYADVVIPDLVWEELVTTAGLDLGPGNLAYMKYSTVGTSGWSGISSSYYYHRVYRRIQESIPDYSGFRARFPTLATWDDHDAPGGEGGGATKSWTLRRQAVQVFRESYAHAQYGGGDGDPGVWHSAQLADTMIWMLDGRTCRTQSTNPAARVIFCPAEEAWLKNGLLASKAAGNKWNILAIGSAWNNQPKTNGPLTEQNYYGGFGDTLASYKFPRDQFLNWIIANQIPGVVLLSGDRHRADITKVWPWPLDPPGPNVFYDLTAGNIASLTVPPAGPVGQDGLVWSYQGYVFGLLDIDTTVTPSRLTYEVWGRAHKDDPVTLLRTFVLQATDFLPEAVP
jgi:phosphodiesterase/alkaline phosphatase D-like protein